jgi:hypothetical protein
MSSGLFRPFLLRNRRKAHHDKQAFENSRRCDNRQFRVTHRDKLIEAELKRLMWGSTGANAAGTRQLAAEGNQVASAQAG